MTFEEWQRKHGPIGAEYEIEMMRAGWDAFANEARGLLRCVSNEVNRFGSVSEETMQAVDLFLQGSANKPSEKP